MKTKELKKQLIKHITDPEKIRKAAIEGAEDQDATYFASITDVFKHYEQRLKDKDEAHKKELEEMRTELIDVAETIYLVSQYLHLTTESEGLSLKLELLEEGRKIEQKYLNKE